MRVYILNAQQPLQSTRAQAHLPPISNAAQHTPVSDEAHDLRGKEDVRLGGVGDLQETSNVSSSDERGDLSGSGELLCGAEAKVVAVGHDRLELVVDLVLTPSKRAVQSVGGSTSKET